MGAWMNRRENSGWLCMLLVLMPLILIWSGDVIVEQGDFVCFQL